MNHLPIYGTRPPAFCSIKGDTADPERPVDCPRCRRRLEESAELYNLLADRARGTIAEHRNRAQAMHYEALLETAQ